VLPSNRCLRFGCMLTTRGELFLLYQQSNKLITRCPLFL
jgi:hypothetical protein